MLEEIKKDLADNYREDEAVLQSIIDEVTADALSISNRNTSEVKVLKSEIKKCVITIYLQRGSEDAKSRSESGVNSTYIDAKEEMRNNIIKNGKRVIF